jgi:putative colanic acid biosynthesis acetyltransferase WcaF
MMEQVDLSQYDNSWYRPGRGFLTRTLWHYVNVIFLQSPLNPSSLVKRIVLRWFGAKVGTGVILKPGISVKYPWNIEIGDYSWIGENAWLDSLDKITIGAHACISQGAYLCTGNHDWSDPAFGLIVKPITVEEGAWVGARAVVLPGVTIANHSVIAAGAVITGNTEPYTVYSGNPASAIKTRVIQKKLRHD